MSSQEFMLQQQRNFRRRRALLFGYAAMSSAKTRAETFVFHGDSITSDTTSAGTNIFPNYLKLLIEARQGIIVNSVKRGISGSSWNYDFGATVPTLIADAPTSVDPYRTSTAKLILFAGTNGLKLGGNTPAQEYSAFQTYITARLAAGWSGSQIYVLTMLPRESYVEANRTTYNNSLISGAGTYGYSVVQIHNNLDFGIAGSQNNATWFDPDQIHPTPASHQQIAETVYDSMYTTGWSVGTWTPRDIGNLCLWLDANDATTLNLTGSSVNAWADKSGAGLITSLTGVTTTRPNYSATAFNSKPGVTFDGVDDMLNATGLSGFPKTVAFGAVVRFAGLAPESTVFDFGATNGTISGVGASLYYQSAITAYGFGAPLSDATFSDTTTAHSVTGFAGLTRRRPIIDGTTLGLDRTTSGTDTTVTLFRLGRMLQGSFWPMNGTICELVMSSTGAVLTDINRQRLQNYLKAKWGTP